MGWDYDGVLFSFFLFLFLFVFVSVSVGVGDVDVDVERREIAEPVFELIVAVMDGEEGVGTVFVEM